MKYIFISLLFFLTLSLKSESKYIETGKACFYSSKFNGRRTSSGEVFSQENLTAAHKTLTLGTFVKVTNLENDSTIIVKVNDRLHKSSGHVIDLSLKAANHLNFVRNGSAKVKVELVTNSK
jgi:rare lipoprotein A